MDVGRLNRLNIAFQRKRKEELLRILTRIERWDYVRMLDVEYMLDLE